VASTQAEPNGEAVAMSAPAETGEISGSKGKAVLTPAARSSRAKVDSDSDEHAS